MPRGERTHDLDARAWAYLDRAVNVDVEITYLRAGSEPPWERPKRDGVDITDRPELWTPYQTARRHSFEDRVERYRADGLIP